MTAHTPGPWTYRDTDNDAFEISTDGTHYYREGIATVWSAAATYTDLRNTGEANARLIAAAPDLLEAAQALTDLLLYTAVRPKEAQPETNRRVDALLAAIAKATGVEP